MCQKVYKLRAIWQSNARMIPYKIFAGSSHKDLAQSMAAGLNKDLSPITIKHFACGEIYVKFDESFRGQDVFLLQTCRTGHMNDDLMELFLMIDAARQSFARNIHVILPYFAYSRQDKIHEAREGISAKLFADLMVKAGAGHVVTLHLHSDQIQGFFDVPVDNLNPRRIFVDYFAAKKLKDAVNRLRITCLFVSPLCCSCMSGSHNCSSASLQMPLSEDPARPAASTGGRVTATSAPSTAPISSPSKPVSSSQIEQHSRRSAKATAASSP